MTSTPEQPAERPDSEHPDPTAPPEQTWQAPPPPPPPPPPPASAPPPPSTAYPPPQPGAAAVPPPAYAATTAAPLSPNDEKTWALATHLLCLVGGFVAPLIVWLVFKGRGPFLEHHAKEALNFQITVMIAVIIAIVTAFILVGFVLLLLLVPWMLIMPIIAAVKASGGEWYRYPLTFRFVS